MEVGQIEAFERTAREGNFTRAAEALQLTQPAISTRISTLENELGGQLFERRGRQLYLTPLGERFLPYAQRMLTVMAESLEAVHDFQAGEIGQVRIATPTPFLLSYLIRTLENFRQEYAKVDILIRERNKTTIFDMLVDHTMVLGLVNAPVFDSRFEHLHRFRDPIQAVIARSHPLVQGVEDGAQFRMEALYQHMIYRVSLFPRMSVFIDEVVEHARGGSGGAVVAVPMVMALRLVRQGKGITFLPESYIKAAVATDELMVLDVVDMPKLYSEPILIALKGRQLDPVHEQFTDMLCADWDHLLVQ